MKQFAIGLDSNDERVQVITQDGNHLCYIEQDPVWEYAHLIAAAPKMHKLLTTLWGILQEKPTGLESYHPGFMDELTDILDSVEGREQ